MLAKKDRELCAFEPEEVSVCRALPLPNSAIPLIKEDPAIIYKRKGPRSGEVRTSDLGLLASDYLSFFRSCRPPYPASRFRFTKTAPPPSATPPSPPPRSHGLPLGSIPISWRTDTPHPHHLGPIRVPWSSLKSWRQEKILEHLNTWTSWTERIKPEIDCGGRTSWTRIWPDFTFPGRVEPELSEKSFFELNQREESTRGTKIAIGTNRIEDEIRLHVATNSKSFSRTFFLFYRSSPLSVSVLIRL